MSSRGFQPAAGARLDTIADLSREGALAHGLALLEAAVEPGEGADLDELAATAAPEPLAFLFRLHLTRLLRQGPGWGPRPTGRNDIHRLLRLAEVAAGRGGLPLALPGELRRGLGRMEAGLVRASFWAEGVPPWWRPLPDSGCASEEWRKIEAVVRWPAADDLTGFAERPWRTWPSLLPPGWAGQLHGEVEAARAALGLEAGEVGRGHLDDRRSDRVRYLSGYEPELLERVPRAAALVQVLLARLPAALAPLGDYATPQRAMIARYPAPSRGFDPHLDNPGDRDGFDDNGRALTLVLYLNDPNDLPEGGEIALWAPGHGSQVGEAADAPVCVQPAVGGSAVLFDSRTVPHQVRPLRAGPARWALTVWLRDRADAPSWTPPLPGPSASDIVAAVPDPPAPPGRVLLHRLEDSPRGPRVEVESVAVVTSAPRSRCGLVATVYDAGDELVPWARHHLEAGFDHLLVIFDRPEEPAEAVLMDRLGSELAADRVTVWAADEARRRWSQGSQPVPAEWQHGPGSFAPYAHAARQAANAGTALAVARTGELGGKPLDWLLHLDVDEWFHLQGSGRGGTTVPEHFAALEAAGLDHVTYVNHELLRPHPPDGPPRYKLNPRLAAARLGTAGWQALVDQLGMAQNAERPWFAAYWNGKSAVRVDVARAAAGVHRWEPAGATTGRTATIAGPVILHHHLPTAESFRRKYTRALTAPDDPHRPFPPSPLEAAARRVIETGGDLEALYRRRTGFTDDEVELLEEAGTVLAVG